MDEYIEALGLEDVDLMLSASTHSIAISLKRIADVLEKQAVVVGADDLEGLHIDVSGRQHFRTIKPVRG